MDYLEKFEHAGEHVLGAAEHSVEATEHLLATEAVGLADTAVIAGEALADWAHLTPTPIGADLQAAEHGLDHLETAQGAAYGHDVSGAFHEAGAAIDNVESGLWQAGQDNQHGELNE